MAFSPKKRFIAGVVCPKCSVVDKLLVFSDKGVDFRECVACGFRDQIRINSIPKEIETRVNRSAKELGQRIDTVRMVDD